MDRSFDAETMRDTQAASTLPDANPLPNLCKPEDGTVWGVVKQITD
jgi:hypothetical protein